MRVLLLGSGGREAALAWRLASSPLCERLWAMPGNPGLAAHATCLAGDPCDVTQVLSTARAHQIDLVVVGPEAPLMAGVTDALSAEGVAVFGPSRGAALIEGSKAFAKDVMLAAGVPTARAEVFTDREAAARRARTWGTVVVKADGLAAGKGVIVADTGAEAEAAVRQISQMPGGGQLVLEERLSGPELSVIALCDGEHAVLLPPAQDHKRLLEGDHGPNTGGMGTWAPAPLLTQSQLNDLVSTVFLPTLRELKKRGHEFRGALFAGLMLTPEGPRVLEFNARFGDPETQSIMMMLESDLLPRLHQCAVGQLSPEPMNARSGTAVTIVAAAHGYPEAVRSGDAIDLRVPENAELRVFQAGTRMTPAGQLVTSGGRVLAVTAHGATLAEARSSALAAMQQVQFDGMQYRRDIAAKY